MNAESRTWQMRENHLPKGNIVLPILLLIVLPVIGFAALSRTSFRPQASNQALIASLSGSVTTTPPSSVAIKHSINWATPHAYVKADNFSITVKGEKFYGIPDEGTTVYINSDPPDPPGYDYTTLEAVWRERGDEMRLYIYFYRDSRGWWTSEQRTYNGQIPGDWVYYDGYLGQQLNLPFKARGLVLTTTPQSSPRGFLEFENLRLEAFLQQ